MEDLDKNEILQESNVPDKGTLPVTPQKMERTSSPEQILPQGQRGCLGQNLDVAMYDNKHKTSTCIEACHTSH